MLTRSGLGGLITSVILGALGLWWHYEELLVVAACLLAVIVVALWSGRSRQRTKITRIIAAPRVARGDPIHIVYRVSNTSRRRAARAVIVDQCDESEVRVAYPALAADDRTEVDGILSTRRRGVFQVGPWAVERVDPFGLAVGLRTSDSTSTIIVHPRIHALQGPYGSMHTVENESVMRRTAFDPLSGFVSLREYVIGDDPRLIHWLTTARMGTLMIREHVELRRPEFTVVLDCSDGVATADDFEEMVDVAASVAVHAIRSGVQVTVRTTDRNYPGALRPLDRDTMVLDLLTPVTQVAAHVVTPLPELFRGGFDHTTIVFVTGPAGPSSTLAQTERLSVVRIGDGAVVTPGITLASTTATEFVQRWRPWR